VIKNKCNILNISFSPYATNQTVVGIRDIYTVDVATV
jgi:hypothetical protein